MVRFTAIIFQLNSIIPKTVNFSFKNEVNPFYSTAWLYFIVYIYS